MTKPHTFQNYVEAPIFFADQPAGLIVGAHVSRITFGVREANADESGYPRPVVTIALPTTALLDLVSDLRLILDDDSFKRNVVKQLDATTKKLTKGLKSTLSTNVKKATTVTKGASKKKVITVSK